MSWRASAGSSIAWACLLGESGGCFLDDQARDRGPVMARNAALRVSSLLSVCYYTRVASCTPLSGRGGGSVPRKARGTTKAAEGGGALGEKIARTMTLLTFTIHPRGSVEFLFSRPPPAVPCRRGRPAAYGTGRTAARASSRPSSAQRPLGALIAAEKPASSGRAWAFDVR